MKQATLDDPTAMISDLKKKIIVKNASLRNYLSRFSRVFRRFYINPKLAVVIDKKKKNYISKCDIKKLLEQVFL